MSASRPEYIYIYIYMCTYRRVGAVPKIDKIAVATSHLPPSPPLLPHSLGKLLFSQPNVAHSGMQWHSGRTGGAFPLHLPHGCGSSPAGDLHLPDSRLASFCVVAIVCSMLLVLWCRAHRVGAIRWLTSGPHYPNGSADLPVGSWCGLVVLSHFLVFVCPFSSVLGK